MSLKLRHTVPTTRHGRLDEQFRDDWNDGQTYELLANARRRECVRYLSNRSPGEEVSVRELADGIADALAGDDPTSENLRQSVYTSLTQYHLEKLDDYGVIDYDPEARTLSTGPNFERVDRVTGVSNPRKRALDAVPIWTSALTLAALVVTTTAYPHPPTPAVLGVAIINVLPVGLFVHAYLGE